MILEEIFIPKRRIIINNKKTKNHYIITYNGKTNLYETVYTYTDQIDIFHVNVDKIFLDFDKNKDMKFFNDVKKVAQYLKEKNYQFYIRFSGRGFHIFILMNDTYLTNPKRAIKQYVKHLHKITNSESDKAVVGDLRRVARIPGTINLKSNFYCIPITYDELMNNTYEEICNIAKTSREVPDYIIGDKKIDISKWDEKEIKSYKEVKIQTTTVITNEIPDCIKCLMKNPFIGYRERFIFIIFFRELGYTEDEITNMLSKFLSEEKFEHCIEEEHQVSYLMERTDLLFPSCENIKIDGLCPNKECQGHNLYY